MMMNYSTYDISTGTIRYLQDEGMSLFPKKEQLLFLEKCPIH